MIAIASPATPQLSSLSPLVVRPRRRRSPEDAPGAYPEHDCRENMIAMPTRMALRHAPSSEIVLDRMHPLVRRRRRPLKSP